MDEEIKNKMMDLLTWAEGAAKTGSDFIVEQTPLYIQELLVYNFWTSLIWFIISFLFLIGSIYATYKSVKWMCESDNSEGFPLLLFLLMPLVLSVCGMADNTDWIKIKLTPRVYIVDYLREQIKK